ADVVADRQPDGPVLELRDDRFGARLLRLRLAVDVTADLDVEEVDLAVDGDELAAGVEDAARVRELLAPFPTLRDRAADERDAERARPARHRLDRLAALERLGPGAIVVGAPDQVPLLGQDDDVRARRRGAGDEGLGALEVRGLVLPRGQLHAGDADAVGHDARIDAQPRGDPPRGADDRGRRRVARLEPHVERRDALSPAG